MRAGRRIGVHRSCFMFWLLLVLAATIAGCGRSPHFAPPARPGDAPFDVITIASTDSVGLGTFWRDTIPSSYYSGPLLRWPRTYVARPLPPGSRFHPSLRKYFAPFVALPRDSVDLVITFHDHVQVPRFPEPIDSVKQSDALNDQVRMQSQAMARSLVGQRSQQYAADSTDLVTNYGSRILRKYWITQAMLVRVATGKVEALTNRMGNLYVQPKYGPPAPDPTPGTMDDGDRMNDIVVARDNMRMKAYLENGLGRGWMGLLDTGVDANHWMLKYASFQNLVNCDIDYDLLCEDCPACTYGGAPDVAIGGHGTGTAGILVGTSDYNESRFRGVTSADLNVFRVYGSEGVSVPAVLEAIQNITLWRDRILVAEMQDCSRAAAAVSSATDHAFDAGCAIIAAVGNLNDSNLPMECDTKIGNPAAARKAIGVGAVGIINPTTDIKQSRGITHDDRVKPDIQAYTDTETAALGLNNAHTLGDFNLTSGATPYAAGVAALWRGWLDQHGGPIDPGQIYALMILSGRTDGPFPASSATGAGLMVMPTNATARYGKIQLKPQDDTFKLPIDVTIPGDKRIEVGIWWPETLMTTAPTNTQPPLERETHNNIDLTIEDPDGVVRGKSAGDIGVFERASVTIHKSGRWIVRIKAKSFLQPPQNVYFAAVVRR